MPERQRNTELSPSLRPTVTAGVRYQLNEDEFFQPLLAKRDSHITVIGQ